MHALQTYLVTLPNAASMHVYITLILITSLLPSSGGGGGGGAGVLAQPVKQLEIELCTYHTKHPVMLITGEYPSGGAL